MKCLYCDYKGYDFWISKVKMEQINTWDKLRLYACPKCFKTFINEDE